MGLKLTPITLAEINNYQDDTLVVEYANGCIVSFTYGEPKDRDSYNAWYFDDGEGLTILKPTDTDVKHVYVVEKF